MNASGNVESRRESIMSNVSGGPILSSVMLPAVHEPGVKGRSQSLEPLLTTITANRSLRLAKHESP